MSPKQVIEQLLFELNTSTNKLSKAIGISSTNLYDIRSGKIRNVSPDLADKIVAVYPQYNRSWLITGEGEPHKQDEQVELPPTGEQLYDLSHAQSIADVKQIVLTLTGEMAAQRETYSKQISDLISIIDKHLTSR